LQESRDQATIPQKVVSKRNRSKKTASKQESMPKKAISGGKYIVDYLLHGFNHCLGNATSRIDLSRRELHTTFSIDAKGQGKISFPSKICHTRD
jgi:hypothetical protein